MNNEQMYDAVLTKMKNNPNKKLNSHRCSLCGYQCGWGWIEDRLMYDNGCDCTGGTQWNSTELADLKQHFDWNWENEHTIKQTKAFLTEVL